MKWSSNLLISLFVVLFGLSTAIIMLHDRWNLLSFPSDPARASQTKDASGIPPDPIVYKDKVVVLMYHHIAPSEANEEITITPERFEKQLQILKDNHFNVISVEDYRNFLKNHQPVPPNAVVITFDDGYESFYKYAYPSLMKFGFTATNFVIVNNVGIDNPKLPFLNWDQILEMKSHGFSFHSHTYNLHHKALNDKQEMVPALANQLYLDTEKRLETEEEYRVRVQQDLLKAKNILTEKLSNESQLLCFPYGAYNSTVIDIAKDIGIEYFFTVKEGINKVKDPEIVRVNAGTRYVSGEKLLSRLQNFREPVAAAGRTQ